MIYKQQIPFLYFSKTPWQEVPNGSGLSDSPSVINMGSYYISHDNFGNRDNSKNKKCIDGIETRPGSQYQHSGGSSGSLKKEVPLLYFKIQ